MPDGPRRLGGGRDGAAVDGELDAGVVLTSRKLVERGGRIDSGQPVQPSQRFAIERRHVGIGGESVLVGRELEGEDAVDHHAAVVSNDRVEGGGKDSGGGQERQSDRGLGDDERSA